MDKKEIITQIRKLRLSDISDALDVMGLVGTQVMDPKMRPIKQEMFPSGCMAGYAFTEAWEFEKNTEFEDAGSVEAYYKKMGEMFKGLKLDQVSPFEDDNTDKVMVVDFAGEPIGLLGSENMMAGMLSGYSGYVIDGGIRDSYEVKIEDIPAWCTVQTCNHFYGRVNITAIKRNVTIQCAGVTVNPGDVVCADDDGVIVIPIEKAELVIKYASEIKRIDQNTRKDHYEKAHKEFDGTLN